MPEMASPIATAATSLWATPVLRKASHSATADAPMAIRTEIATHRLS
jgi:hypothetical protein